MRFSVVIPTHQRRDLAVRTVEALEEQLLRDFEVVVVVDGSTDGTAAALRERVVTFPFTVLEQRNQGSAVARNAGAAAAAGEILLFLDDDMQAHPRLLAEHDRSRREGWDIVFGHLALHRESPPNLLSDSVREWTEGRLQRLSATGGKLMMGDFLTGQMSLPSDLFGRIGGFDETFTREGMFGGEDVDFGYRLAKAACRMVFNAAAITYQLYDVDPADYLLRWREVGRSTEELIFKHPECEEELTRHVRAQKLRRRVVVSTLAAAPPAATWPLRALATHLVRAGRRGSPTRKLFFTLRDVEHRRGARRTRRSWGSAHVLVLAYHAIVDLHNDPVLSDYGVPPAQLAAQLDYLVRRGCRFVGLETVLRGLTEQDFLPAGATLVTFDDAYADLLPAVRSVLQPRGIPAVVFAVAGKVGATNEWDHHLGATKLALLDAAELRELSHRGVATGSHTATHRPLTSLPVGELRAELRGSADQLESMGLPRPRVLAYPNGEWDAQVAAAARDAGYALAFTVAPGHVRRSSNLHALPRVEALAGDAPRRLWLKLVIAGWPRRLRAPVVRLLRVRW